MAAIWSISSDVAADAVAGGAQIGRCRLTLVALQFDNIIAHGAAGAEMPSQSARQELKILGNGVVPQQAAAAYGWLLKQ